MHANHRLGIFAARQHSLNTDRVVAYWFWLDYYDLVSNKCRSKLKETGYAIIADKLGVKCLYTTTLKFYSHLM